MSRSPRALRPTPTDPSDSMPAAPASRDPRPTRRWTVLSRAIDAPWSEAAPVQATPLSELRPVVSLPVGGPAPAARVAAQAELRVKRFGAEGVEDDRYVLPLQGNADPASLLAALAAAAGEISDLSGGWATEDQMVLTVSLRR